MIFITLKYVYVKYFKIARNVLLVFQYATPQMQTHILLILYCMLILQFPMLLGLFMPYSVLVSSRFPTTGMDNWQPTGYTRPAPSFNKAYD